MTDNTSPVTCDIQDSVALIQIDDGKANALSHVVISSMTEALDRAERDARAIVIAGRPGRFSAGFDLKVMTEGPEAMRALVAAGAELYLRIFLSPRPVVIACTGHAMAGGAVMLLSADVCIGVSGDFKIGLNEVAIGMPVPIFAVEMARARLDPRRLVAATSLAQIYDPAEAVEVGYLHQVVEGAALQQTATALAGAMAKGLSPTAFARTRENLRGAIGRYVRDTLADDLASFAINPA